MIPSFPSPRAADGARHDRFRARYGATPDWQSFAPGRVNLIGEHIDYCNGFVLPMAIDRGVTITARITKEHQISAASDGMPDAVIDLAHGVVKPGEPVWGNYLRGAVAGFQRLGAAIPAMQILVESNLPPGAGLSSSAALTVAAASLLEAVSGRALAPRNKALLCQKVEHEYAHVPCGIMDQFASVFGTAEHAIFIDCQSLQVTPIALGSGDVEALVFDTGVKHALASGEYAARRRDCEAAAKHLGVASLRDLHDANWRARIASLPTVLRMRARHVLTEMERVLDFVRIWKEGDRAKAGRLLYASHASLRDDFEVSCEELDFVVEVAHALRGIYGCRMTGGGFGGCCIALVEASRSEEAQRELDAAYRRRFGIIGASFITRAGDGATARKIG